jgi:hypothetical protein
MGGNPQASQGSLLACPDVLGEIDRIRERGGKTVVVDPRRTGTADRADEWIPIQPGTDAAFLLALCHVLFADDLVRLGPLADRVNGVDEVRALRATSRQSAWPMPAASPPRRSAARARDRRRAHVRGLRPDRPLQPGVRHARVVADRRRERADGNFDRPGGLMFGNPIAWALAALPDPQWSEGVQFGRFRSRVRGVPRCWASSDVVPRRGDRDAGPGQIGGSSRSRATR